MDNNQHHDQLGADNQHDSLNQYRDRQGAGEDHHRGRSDRIKRWARHGSTIYIWSQHNLDNVIKYVRNHKNITENVKEYNHTIIPKHGKSPLAYFITFRTYGTFLHGDMRGSVDRKNNIYGTAFINSDPRWERYERKLLKQKPYSLNPVSQKIVMNTIIESCNIKGWILHILSVSTTHVHMVVSADTTPEIALNYLKAYTSRALNTHHGKHI